MAVTFKLGEEIETSRRLDIYVKNERTDVTTVTGEYMNVGDFDELVSTYFPFSLWLTLGLHNSQLVVTTEHVHRVIYYIQNKLRIDCDHPVKMKPSQWVETINMLLEYTNLTGISLSGFSMDEICLTIKSDDALIMRNLIPSYFYDVNFKIPLCKLDTFRDYLKCGFPHDPRGLIAYFKLVQFLIKYFDLVDHKNYEHYFCATIPWNADISFVRNFKPGSFCNHELSINHRNYQFNCMVVRNHFTHLVLDSVLISPIINIISEYDTISSFLNIITLH